MTRTRNRGVELGLRIVTLLRLQVGNLSISIAMNEKRETTFVDMFGISK